MSSSIVIKLISHNSIYPDIQITSTPFIIGRNEHTRIKSTRCARQQVSIGSENNQVFIEQLGTNLSFVNDKALTKNVKHILHDEDKISLIENECEYKVKIERTTAKIDENEKILPAKTTLKRQNSEHDEISMKKSKLADEKLESSSQDLDDEAEENRLKWIQQQLDVLQSNSAKTTDDSTNPITKMNPTSKDSWEKPNGALEVFTSKDVISSDKIAAFDMDGTIILTKSGKVYPVDENDWRIGFDTCFKKFKQLIAENYKIVIFTNQKGLSKVSSTDNFRKKIERIQQKLNVPFQAFIVIHSGLYRKPCTGSWLLLESKYNDNIKIDKVKSFYVGDAAGRPDKWRTKAKKDHSCADRLFAMNIGLRFYTPEEYFLGLSKAMFELPKFDPKSLRSIQTLFEPSTAQLTSNKIEVIVMCGLPASGKSWFAKKHIVPHKYEYINRDEVGTWQKCVKMTETALNKNQNVVIDNTNLDKESRQRYIEVAKKCHVPCRCFLMNVVVEHAKHNNHFRQIIGTDDAHKDVNEIIIMSSNKRFVKPTIDEGFSEILTINMRPEFNDLDTEQLYYQYILDR